MSTLLIVADVRNGRHRSINFELFTAGRQLAAAAGMEASALLIGNGLEGLGDEIGKYGIAKTILVEDDHLASFSADTYAAAIAGAAKAQNAGLVLMGATATGKDVMARAAQLLDSALAQDCTAIRHDGGEFIFTRPMYAGKLLAEVSIDASPALATVRSKAFKAEAADTANTVEKLSLELPAPLVTVESLELANTEKMDVTEADIIVSGGRGLRGPENWGLLEEMATVLGAATGCSRPVSDEGWRPHDEHIGQTGKTVSPTLYLALGISGAIQHIAGMSSSKFIVAVNKDPEAPIFKIADYGLVGDLFEIVPAMTEAFRQLKEDD